jgi:hypothetical protein
MTPATRCAAGWSSMKADQDSFGILALSLTALRYPLRKLRHSQPTPADGRSWR